MKKNLIIGISVICLMLLITFICDYFNLDKSIVAIGLTLSLWLSNEMEKIEVLDE